jgi:predicted DNA-binding transcriptional regulator YafY
MTAGQLASELGVSLRTVYRDLDALSAAGVPLYAEHGRAGGYRLVDGYRTSLTGLTEQESAALFLVGMPAAAAALGLTQPATEAERKLLAALGPDHRERASRLRESFLLDVPPWYREAESPALLEPLTAAVLAAEQVEVRYRRWAEPREVDRVLDPYGLVLKNGVWYLVAADRTRGDPTVDAMRVYRITNILELTVTRRRFDRAADFDLPAFWHRQLADFEARRFTGTATLRVSPRLVARLPDLSDQQLATAVAAGRVEADGACVVELPIESAGHAAAHLIGYGADIEVLAPDEVRVQITDLARSVIDRYAGPRPGSERHTTTQDRVGIRGGLAGSDEQPR